MFGCGECVERGALVFRHDVAQAAYRAQADHLRHMERIDQEVLEAVWDARGRVRRALQAARRMFGLLAAVGPAFAAFGEPRGSGAGGRPPASTATAQTGRVHTVPSTSSTVRLGVFDATLPSILDVDSGDVIVYPDTWTHFLNRLQPGVPIEELARMRRDNPGKGPQSIIGPVGVRDAQPGDMVAVHFQRLLPIDWGVNFNNPGALGTGALPDEFPDGQVRYFDFDLGAMTASFTPGITLPLAPFQGTFGLAPEAGGVVSSVPPGQHAGNLDLRDLTEGSVLYVPVCQTGAKLYTGDSHALQGDGEVNLTALETAMREVRIKVVLHEQAGWAWPFAETDTHWYALGVHPDLGEAFKIALHNTLDFLERKAGLARLDAYALASMAVSFRVTQVVDGNKGVHAMIPKSLFAQDARQGISIV
ncbi:MAG: acetamidase [Chloroflexi bacterium]|nr:MAG: acetamidase [Chloroflexota bacterium]